MLEKVAQGGEEGPPAHPLDEIAKELSGGKNYSDVKALAADQAATGNTRGHNWAGILENVEATGKGLGVPEAPAAAANPPVPYDVMKTARTAVGEALQASRKHFQSTGMGSNAGRALTDLYGSMTDTMKKSLAPHADLTAQFEKANALTKDRNSRFVDPKFVRSLVYNGDSQKVITAVMRSGGEKEAANLNAALERHPLAQKTAQRAAMDYILKRSTKEATGELPGTIRPDKLDYDLAVRNAENSPALKTLLGDEGYTKFHDQLEQKRLAARDPDEVRFEDYLQKVIKSDTPEKAAKHTGDQANFGKLSQVNPDLAKQGQGIQAAAQRASAARTAVEKLKPTVDTKGVQTVTNSVANELQPSKIVDEAAKSPEYTDKLLQMVDRAPNKGDLRSQLGQSVFRNVLDKSMVNGAFGSNESIFDTAKFRSEYQAARPSLERILPEENLFAMDDFSGALRKYSLSRGIGSQAGGNRFFTIRQIMAVSALLRSAYTANPLTALGGVALLKGPKVWMQFATNPSLARAAAEALRSSLPEASTLGKAAIGGAASAVGRQAVQIPPANLWDGKQGKVLTLRNPSNQKEEQWILRNGVPTRVE
jgi:hypothetical protein